MSTPTMVAYRYTFAREGERPIKTYGVRCGCGADLEVRRNLDDPTSRSQRARCEACGFTQALWHMPRAAAEEAIACTAD